jgi:hypothetical protein
MKKQIKENENLKGFKRKLIEIMGNNQVDDVLRLIHKHIIIPLLYVGDEATLEDGSKVIITGLRIKNGQYVYYYISDEDDEVYSYEDEFVF